MGRSDPEVEGTRERAAMVERQLRARGIADERVLAAMASVPREAFIAGRRRDQAYLDAALPIDAGQTISQPYIVALMTELLWVAEGDRVLEIGTGSGYQTAVLASMGCLVTSIERLPELAVSARERLGQLGFGDRVVIRVGDGSLGDADGAPWPRIIVTAAAPKVPEPLRTQLEPHGGRMVIPVGGRWQQELVVVVRRGEADWIERPAGGCVFVPLVGEAGFSG